MTRTAFSVRAATPDDEPFLWRMLLIASHAADDPERTVASLAADPTLARYVEGWGRPGDRGVVAVDGAGAVGAAWLRLLVGDEQSSVAFVDAETPEIAVAVEPGREGLGIGSALLRRLIETVTPHHPRVTLNVRADNPAVRLYERLGFVAVDEIVNRVGTRSLKMVLQLAR